MHLIDLREYEERIRNSLFNNIAKNTEYDELVKNAIRNKANAYDLFLLSLISSPNTFGAVPIVVKRYRSLRVEYETIRLKRYQSRDATEEYEFLKDCVFKSTLYKDVL